MENQFFNLYKKLATPKLLEIIEHAKDYDPLAIETATAELENRKLSSLEIETIKRELKVKEAEEEKKVLQSTDRKKERKSQAFKLLKYADPLAENTPGRSVIALCMILSVVTLFKIISAAPMIRYVLEYSKASNLLNLDTLELVYLPVTIVFIYKRLLIGWRMLFIWLCYHLVFTAVFTYYSFKLKDVRGPLAAFIATPDLSACIMMFVFYGGILYFINKGSVKSLFYKPGTE